MTQIYLLRHSEACDTSVHPDRPLTDKGRDRVYRLGRFLRSFGEDMEISVVIHSPKLRAVQTAAIFRETVAPMAELIDADELLPGTDPRTIVSLANGYGKEIVLVGHLPSLSLAASLFLTGSVTGACVPFEPAEICCLSMDVRREERAVIKWKVPPSLYIKRGDS